MEENIWTTEDEQENIKMGWDLHEHIYTLKNISANNIVSSLGKKIYLFSSNNQHCAEHLKYIYIC